MFTNVSGFFLHAGFSFFYFKMSERVPQCTRNTPHTLLTNSLPAWVTAPRNKDARRSKVQTWGVFWMHLGDSRWKLSCEGYRDRWNKEMEENSSITYRHDALMSVRAQTIAAAPGGALPAVAHVKRAALTFSLSVLISNAFSHYRENFYIMRVWNVWIQLSTNELQRVQGLQIPWNLQQSTTSLWLCFRDNNEQKKKLLRHLRWSGNDFVIFGGSVGRSQAADRPPHSPH